MATRTRNFGAGVVKINEGLIISGSDPQVYVSGNINIDSLTEPRIQFQIGGEDRAKILVNTSNNLVFHNQFVNKHIVFKANDQGVTREGFRIDGAVPEVVVNQGSESMIDFRVESNNNTHMLFVDGGNEKVGIGTASPSTTFHAYANVSNAYVATIDNDQASAGHVLKLLTDGNGSGTRILEMEDGDGDVIFRARADGRFGFGPDGVSSMGAGTFVVGIDNSSHTADIAISKRLQHLGDSNTYLDFPSADTFNLVAGGNSFLKYDSGNILLNNANADVDTKIMADNGAVVLHVDAGTNRVGVGTTGPDRALDVLDSSNPQMRLSHTDGSNYVDFQASAAGDLILTGSASNATYIFTSAGNAKINVQSNAGDGDAEVGFSVDAGANIAWSLGVDDGDSDKFKIGGSTIGANTRLTIDSNGHVGVGTTNPASTLSVAGSIAVNVTYFGQANDPGTTYTMNATDCVVIANTRPTAQGGIDSAITITLPDASDFPGRIVTIKDGAGYSDVNAININAASGDNLDGNPSTTTTNLPTPASFKTLVSDGVNSWYEIGS
tara:strand:+ start:12777 stop:14432 length:1656 start_codon:yes stop_codon:yes gene_type:complete